MRRLVKANFRFDKPGKVLYSKRQKTILSEGAFCRDRMPPVRRVRFETNLGSINF